MRRDNYHLISRIKIKFQPLKWQEATTWIKLPLNEIQAPQRKQGLIFCYFISQKGESMRNNDGNILMARYTVDIYDSLIEV